MKKCSCENPCSCGHDYIKESKMQREIDILALALIGIAKDVDTPVRILEIIIGAISEIKAMRS